MDDDQQSHTFKLHAFAYTGINLRDAVSLFSRVTISSEQVQTSVKFVQIFSELLHFFFLPHQPPGQ